MPWNRQAGPFPIRIAEASMSERDYVGVFVWTLAFMITVGGLIRDLWPSLIHFVDRAFLKQPDTEGH